MMGTCEKCGTVLTILPCPEKRKDCLVCHFGCPKCIAKKRIEAVEKEVIDALREANGL